MAINFLQTDHRAFDQSPGRERNTIGLGTIPGYRRRTSFLGLSHFYHPPEGGPTPAPPAGVVIGNANPDNLTHMLMPTDYPGIFVHVLYSAEGSNVFGNPLDLTSVPWALGTIFRIRIRTWGLAQLCNPWFPPLEYDFPDSVRVNHVIDAVQRYQFRFAGAGGPIFNSAHGIDVSLNAIEESLVSESGDPRGLWKFDRIITAYGQIDSMTDASRHWDIVTSYTPAHPATPASSNGIYIQNEGFLSATQFNFMEPNSTLTNPIPPFPVAVLPPEDQERASHLFDWRDLPFGTSSDQDKVVWCSNGVAAFLIDFAIAPAVLPTEYDNLIMEQVSQLRP